LDSLCSPAEAALLERRDVLAFLRDVRHGSLSDGHRDAVDRLIALAEDCLGFSLFQAIEQSKHALSEAPQAPFVFDYPTVEIRDRLERSAFDQWSEKSRAALFRALDETLARARVASSDVDLVCLTGGTAKVPAVIAELSARFGSERIWSHRAFHSVTHGLALHAQSLLTS
jgi:hypothetical chaperone protein